MVIVVDRLEPITHDEAVSRMYECQWLDGCARAVFVCWHELMLADGAFPPGSRWPWALAALGDFVADDTVRDRLWPMARWVVDSCGPELARCRRCGQRLAVERERERDLCTDCALEFLWDADNEAEGDDELD